MSEIRQRLESIIVVDFGTTTTKAVLLDTVEGQYRVIACAEAPSTVYDPWQDVFLGAISAVSRLETITGREFLDGQNRLITPEHADGRGVDRLLAVSSAAEPLRVILVGLAHDVSLASARRAALSTYTTIEDVVALERDPAHEQPRTDSDKINALFEESVDVILLVGGTDGGADRPLVEMIRDVVRVALHMMGSRAPLVLYAGNAALRQEVAQHLEKVASMQAVDNVRPAVDVEDIGPTHEELDVLFYRRKMRAVPGIGTLRAWTRSVVLPTARAADYAIRCCEQIWEASKAALGVDIGSSNVTINVARDGQSLTTIRTDLGIGYGLLGLLERVEIGDILRWLPFEMDKSEARDRLLNKALNPHAVPQTRHDVLLEQAAARELLRLTLLDALPGWPGGNGIDLQAPTIPPCEPIVAGGGVLAHAPHPGQAALILLDALQPVGLSKIYLDECNLLPALGIVANVEPLATVQTLHNNGLLYLGTLVVPSGRARPGDRVLTVRSLDRPASVKLDVRYGDLKVASLRSSRPETTLELIPARGFDVGHGPGKSTRIQYRAGSVGLIVDARGRPLTFDANPKVQRGRMDDWLTEMTSDRGP